jgi:hypothetical protein
VTRELEMGNFGSKTQGRRGVNTVQEMLNEERIAMQGNRVRELQRRKMHMPKLFEKGKGNF